MGTRGSLTTWLGFSTVMVVLAVMPAPARAQYGMGAGWGWGMFGVQPSPSTSFLNQHAATRAAAGRPARASHSAYSGNPNAYFNRIRDNGFVSHYDVRRRRAPSYQTGRTGSTMDRGREESRPAPPEASTAAIIPLANFFDASSRLVWPQESPVDGDFKERRDESDRAVRAVLKEKQQHGAASITGATEARQHLVDYGRPALRQLRAASTPPIVDSFHRFLLSLYDSLGASAGLPEPAPGPP